MRLGKLDEAFITARQGLTIDYRHEICLLVAGNIEGLRGNIDEHNAALENALYQNPSNPLTRANVGYAYLNRGEHKKALVHFQEAVRLDPVHPFIKAGFTQTLNYKYWHYRLFYYALRNIRKYALRFPKFAGYILAYLCIGVCLLFLWTVALAFPITGETLLDITILVPIAAIALALLKSSTNTIKRFFSSRRGMLTREQIHYSNFFINFILTSLSLILLITSNTLFKSLLGALLSITGPLLTWMRLSKSVVQQVAILLVSLQIIITVIAVMISFSNPPDSQVIFFLVPVSSVLSFVYYADFEQRPD